MNNFKVFLIVNWLSDRPFFSIFHENGSNSATLNFRGYLNFHDIFESAQISLEVFFQVVWVREDR